MLQRMSLNGVWKLRWSDGQRGRMDYANRDETDMRRYIDAQVPGEAHLDAWKAGWIEDPYVGTHCLAARWVEECYWSYRREFETPPEALKGRAWLNFEGLDLVAVIVLNGEDIGRHHNSFYPCRIEVTGKLRPGRNVLAVHLEGGLFDAADKPGKGYMGRNGCLVKRHWLRKPQCQFGWDWSTRLINVGIHKPVYLEWTDSTVRLDQFVPLATLSKDLTRGDIRARLFVEGLSGEEQKGEFIAELVGTDQKTRVEVNIKPGLQAIEADLSIRHPLLWWPVGQGPQNRYAVKATLRVDGELIGEKTLRMGFRHVNVNQEPHPRQGRYFILEVNGRKLFAKGGNCVPADMIFARLDRARYETLIDRALEANFNMLRVWGGGLYESDDFYDLCDEKGLLVWQEFIFACGKYPATDQIFYDDVKQEAVFNIRRLAPHPSLVIWCGNNEMEWGSWNWGYDQGIVYPDYALFHLTLPRLLAEEDPTRYYQPSSPYSPEGLPPNSDDVGDQHPWSVGFRNTDFRDYRTMTCRFPNEGGTLGPTALPTMLACLPEGQRFPASFAWQVHDNSVDSWGEPSFPDEMIRQWLGLDPRAMTLEDFAYWAGLIQGEGLREYCDNFRRRMFDSAAAIFWMFNDCWPATRSWTIVDYYLRRTPSFYPVRRAMAPVSIVLAQEKEDVIIFGINDTQEAVVGTLRFGLFTMAGELPLDRRQDVTLPPNASTPLASFQKRLWEEPSDMAAFGVLSRGETLIARNRLFLPFFKELQWAPAKLKVRRENGRAVFESDTFVWGVCLDLDGETPLPDNFFDIYPHMPYSLPWPSNRPLNVIRAGNLA